MISKDRYSATNLAVATVTNAMVIAGLEMLMDPGLNKYCTTKDDQVLQRLACREYRIKAIRRVLQSELRKPSVIKGDPQYFLIIKRFHDMPTANFLENLERLPYVGKRGNECPVYDMPGAKRPVVGEAKPPIFV